ncbi:hypothetical protein PIB30_046481 [Stylosanthes scabra]|uniref:Uncharacterized protein n=1 Tax=Stylosanthes scabra TaxID=79078 RepID=A0ABU6UFR7_9FABA|nr:hypothetical protein [Stylosanthes scabra]
MGKSGQNMSYHNSLNHLVSEANIALSVDYRLASKHPLTIACCLPRFLRCFQWVAFHAFEENQQDYDTTCGLRKAFHTS